MQTKMELGRQKETARQCTSVIGKVDSLRMMAAMPIRVGDRWKQNYQLQMNGLNFNQTAMLKEWQSLKDDGNLYGSAMPCNQQIPESFHTKTGHWNQRQNAKYYAFLKRFAEKFEEKGARRFWKVFKFLSNFIETRNANQCRSHHHKMQKDCGSPQEILDSLLKRHPGLKRASQKHQKELQAMDFQDFAKKSKNESGPYPYSSHDYNMLKQNDIAFKKTCEEYPEVQQSDFGFCNNLEMPINPPKRSFDTFPTTGILEEGLTNGSPGGGSLPGTLTSREQRVLECHYYFLKYMSSMKSLIEDTSMNYSF